MFKFKVKDTFSVHKACTKLLTVTCYMWERETKEKKMYILELYYITLYLHLLSELPIDDSGKQ